MGLPLLHAVVIQEQHSLDEVPLESQEAFLSVQKVIECHLLENLLLKKLLGRVFLLLELIEELNVVVLNKQAADCFSEFRFEN